MAEKSYEERVLERMEQIDKDFVEGIDETSEGFSYGTRRLTPAQYDAYKQMLLTQYPPQWLMFPDGTVRFESPVVVFLRDTDRVLNKKDVWPDVAKAMGVKS